MPPETPAAAPIAQHPIFHSGNRMMLPLAILSVGLAGQCTTSADCAGKNMTVPTCVNQTGGGWTQCVDCEATAFEYACEYWGPGILKPAEQACGLKCTGQPPQNLTCTSDKQCPPSNPRCVIQSDGNYAQCITCANTQFQRDCVDWDQKKFLPRAEAKCQEECTGSGGLACHTDDDCASVPGAPTCVVQPDGYYAQCITCDPTQFQRDCVDWDVAEFLPAAEAKCKETCDRVWWKSFGSAAR